VFVNIVAITVFILHAAIAALAFLGVVLVGHHIGKPIWSEEAAGWAQAIGSVVAIGVAIELSRRQSKAAIEIMIEADLRTVRRKASSVSGILHSACKQMKNAGEDLRGEKLRRDQSAFGPLPSYFDRMCMTIALDHMRDKTPFLQILKAIDAIPLHELDSGELVGAVADVRDALINFQNHICHALQAGEDKYNDTSLWNSTNVWPGIAIQAALRFDTAAAKLANEKSIILR
jgi:hypothetical protein